MSRPNFEETIIIPPLLTDWQALPLITDTQYLEPLASNSLNRKFYGIVRAGVFRGFECAPAGGMKLRVSSGEQFGVALVERDDYILTVRQQHDIDVEIPAGATSYVVLEAFYKHGVKTKQVDLSSDVEASEIKVLPQSAVEPHHLILCRATVPTGASELTLIHLNFDDREQGGYDLQGHVSHPDPHKQYAMRDEAKAHYADHNNPHGVTKEQIKLGNVPNYPATSSVSDPSNEKFATAGAVKQAYDKGVEGLDRGNAAYTRAEQAETNANKHTDDRISTLLGGAPAEALDTIKELGDALMEQGDAAAAIAANIAQHKSDTSNPHKVTKAQVGLPNVPNYAFTAAVNDASDVKFAAAGAVKKAYDLAASKMTQAQADERYLKLSGGTITNILSVGSSKFLMDGVNMMGASDTVTRFGDASHARVLNLNAKDGNVSVSNGSNTFRAYHEGYKPTSYDVGAVTHLQLPALGDFSRVVLLLHRISGGASDFRFFNGKVVCHRANGNTPQLVVNIESHKRYNSTSAAYRAYNIGAGAYSETYMATCVYGGNTYLCLHIYPGDAQFSTSVVVEGRWDTNPVWVAYKGKDGVILNTEINNSLTKLSDLERPYTQVNKPTADELGVMPLTSSDAKFNWNNTDSIMPSHYFHNIYGGNKVYIHAYPSSAWSGQSSFEWRTRNGSDYSTMSLGSTGSLTVKGNFYSTGGTVQLAGKVNLSYSSSKVFAIHNVDAGKAGWFGARNTAWFHLETDATNGFYSYSHIEVPTLRARSNINASGNVAAKEFHFQVHNTGVYKSLHIWDGGTARGNVWEMNNPNESGYLFYADKTMTNWRTPKFAVTGSVEGVAVNATGAGSGQGVAFSGKTVVGGANDSWLRLNPHGQFPSGIYCGGTGVFRHDAQIQAGAWSSGNKASRAQAGHYDSSWGNNGIAAFSVNNPNSSGAHWAFASYYDASNIRSGMQILSNSGGNIRFYTNGRSKYAEIVDGNVYVSASQSSAAHSLTRKDYVDSEISKTKLVLEHLFPVGHVIITFNTANPSTYGYPGTWVRMDNDTTLYSTTGTPSTTPKGSNTPNVPVAAHTHKYARVTKYRNQGNTNPGYHEIDMPTDNTWGLAVETGRSTPRTVAMSFMGNMENTASSGTSGATLDVRGKRYDVAMWRRTK